MKFVLPPFLHTLPPGVRLMILVRVVGVVFIRGVIRGEGLLQRPQPVLVDEGFPDLRALVLLEPLPWTASCVLLGWLDAVTSFLATHGEESERMCGQVPSLLHMDVTASFHREDVIEVSDKKGEENRGDKLEVMLEAVSLDLEMVLVVVVVMVVVVLVLPTVIVQVDLWEISEEVEVVLLCKVGEVVFVFWKLGR